MIIMNQVTMYTDPDGNKDTKAKGKQEDWLQSKLYRLYRKQMDEKTDVKTTCFPLALDNCDGKLQCTMVYRSLTREPQSFSLNSKGVII